MKIIGGRFRGTQLASLSNPNERSRSSHFRPTTGRARENVFNLLTNSRLGNRVLGSRVLDAFAGSGALGLEALSRGADSVLLIDNDPAACAVIRKNIERLGASETARCLRADALKPGPCPGHPFDLVFLDPPYRQDLGARMLARSTRMGWLSEGAVIVWEEAERQDAPTGFELMDVRKYGGTHIHLLRWNDPGSEEPESSTASSASTPVAGR